MRRLVLAVFFVAAGFQPLPHPFADTGSIEASPALRPPDSAGILVLPVAGAPSVAPALARALREAEVPALVAVRGVSGAPGDGGTALARAIAVALARAGVEVGEGGAKARFALSC